MYVCFRATISGEDPVPRTSVLQLARGHARGKACSNILRLNKPNRSMSQNVACSNHPWPPCEMASIMSSRGLSVMSMKPYMSSSSRWSGAREGAAYHLSRFSVFGCRQECTICCCCLFGFIFLFSEAPKVFFKKREEGKGLRQAGNRKILVQKDCCLKPYMSSSRCSSKAQKDIVR